MTLKDQKPRKQLNGLAAKTPPAYRPQPTPKCLQLKTAARRASVTNETSVKKHGPTAPPAYRPQSVPKVLQRKVRSQPASQMSVFGVIQRAAPARVRKAPEWNEYVIIGMPAPKHILEKMKAGDANGKKKVSVVREQVAADAVAAIGAHVKANGWTSGNGIVMEKLDEGGYKITYQGNEWMTHVDSGQLWPLQGDDIFSPPEGEDVRPYINKWKSAGLKPNKYMGK